MEETTERKTPRTILVTVSVTYPEGEGEPLVAARIVDGDQQVQVPFTLVLGGSDGAMTVSGNYTDVREAIAHASAVLNSSTRFASSVLGTLQQAVSPRNEQPNGQQPTNAQVPQPTSAVNPRRRKRRKKITA